MEKLADLGSILNYRKPTHKSDDVATNGNFWADEPVCPTGPQWTNPVVSQTLGSLKTRSRSVALIDG